MTTPTFDFTDRAVPVVQFGRSENRSLGNDRWGTARWGIGKWGAKDWEPLWTDVTCEIHELTVDVGRGGAVDRFSPGTADIVASNVHDLSQMIWPKLPPPPNPFEYIPQPPVTAEEELQAPGAATVTSNGWSFTDDFERVPPTWTFPSPFATTGTFPTRPMVWGDRYVAPEMYGNWPGSGTATRYEAHGVMQWTRAYDPGENLTVGLVVTGLSWPSAPVAGSPELVVDLYYGMRATDRSANVARFTFTPNFSGANGVAVDIFRMAADGSTVSGSESTTFTTTLGSDGNFPTLTLTAVFARETSESGIPSDTIRATVNNQSTQYGIAEWAPGGRVGFAMHYVQGDLGGLDRPDAPHATAFAGPDFDETFVRPPGAGWVVNSKLRADGPTLVEGGAMRAPVRYEGNANGIYYADGSAQWVSEFDGDQVIEMNVSGVSMPPLYNISETTFEMYLKGNRHDRSSVAAVIYYLPGGGVGGTLGWMIARYGPNGEYDTFVDGGITIDDWGTYPEPATLRLEADTLGEARLYHQGALLGTANFDDMPQGGRIGLKYHWGGGGPEPGTLRPTAPRIEQVAAGLREPLGTEELGTWVRIGIDHATLGNHWLFRGFVDGIVPTYLPDHPDTVRIECIDSLGEAGRVQVDGDKLPHRFAPAPYRINKVLDAASWPQKLRQIHDDSTLMSRPQPAKAVEALTRIAESCGGAVYGDPVTGDVVFRQQDWQAAAIGQGPDVYITNARDELIPAGIPKVCPAGWEMTQRRSDVTTRVRLTSVTSDTEDGDPIVREWRSPELEAIYGVELYEATLLAITSYQLDQLAKRQLRVEGVAAGDGPRVQACLLDASTADEALDLMTTATFTGPTVVQGQLRQPGEWVFNRTFIVTGIRHVIKPDQWTCRLGLDFASPFREEGGHWGHARWGIGTWGRTR